MPAGGGKNERKTVFKFRGGRILDPVKGAAIAVAALSASLGWAAGAVAESSPATVVVALPPLTSINWYLPVIPVAYNSLYNVWVSRLMYKGLFHIGRDGAINYSRSIADRIVWNSAGTVYTVTMNPKWRWSSGLPVTSRDVLFTWNVIQAAAAANAPAPWPYVNVGSGGIPNLVKGVKIDGPRQFTVTLRRPTNQLWFVDHGLADFVPLPAASWNRYPSDRVKEIEYLAQNGNNPAFFKVVDGPFRLSAVSSNVTWTLTPNSHYNGHKPYINRLILQGETSDASEFNALRTGAVQVGYLPLSLYGARGQLKPDRIVATKNYDVYRTILNLKSPRDRGIFGQLAVRQALQMGIDQNAIIRILYHGLAAPGTGPVPASPASYLAPALRRPVYLYNPGAAKSLLEKNGWRMKGGVMTSRSGDTLTFRMVYPSGSLTSQTEAELIQQDWRAIGVRIHLQALPFAKILQLHHQYSQWDILTGLAWNYGAPYPTGGGMYETGGGYNFFGYSNPEMDRLIAATHAPQPSEAAAQRVLDAYQVYVARQLPNLFMPVPEGLTVIAPGVRGVVSTANPVTQLLSPQYWRTGGGA